MGLFIGTKEELAASRRKKAGRSKGGKAFDKEFARQKSKGAKNFKFGGKSYSTKTAPGGAAKSTMAAVKPKGAAGPTALAKKTTVLPKPAPRSGLPNKAPIPGKRPEGAAAAVKSVPTPTPRPSTVRRPGSPDGPRGSQHSASEGDRNPTTARPDNVGNVPPPKSRPPVYFGPDMKRGVEERKIATNKAMQSAQQRTKDIAAKRQFVRNQPPAPSKYPAGPTRPGSPTGPRGSQVKGVVKAFPAGQTNRTTAFVGGAVKPGSPTGPRGAQDAGLKSRTTIAVRPAGVPQPLSAQQKLDRAMSQAKARSAVADKRGERTGDVTRFATASVKPAATATVRSTSSATPADKTAALLAKARANSAATDAKVRAANKPTAAVAAVKRPAAGVERGGYTRPKLKLGIWRN